MSLQTIVAPPAPTPAVAAPAAAPTAATDAAAAAAAAAASTDAAAAAAASKKGKSRHGDGNAVDRINKRFSEAVVDETAAKAEGKTIEQYRADKDAAAAKTVVADTVVKPAVTPDPTKTETDLSDADFKAHVESETKGMDPTKSQSWAQLRYSERALKRAQADMVPKAEIEALKVQLEAAKTVVAADPAELTALKTKLAEYESELNVVKVEKTDAFKNGVTAVRENIQTAVAKMAKKYDLKPNELMAALNDTSDDQSDLVEKAISEMNTLDKSKFLGFISETSKANATEATLRGNAKEALDKINANATGKTQEQTVQAKAAREAATKKTWETVEAGELKDIMKPIENAPEWTKAQQDAKSFASTLDFNALAPEDQSVVAQRAAVYPLVMGVNQQLTTQLADLNAKYEVVLTRLAAFDENKGRGGSLTEKVGEGEAASKETDTVKRIGDRIEAAKRAGTIR